ncbi:MULTISPECIES: putative toxin-antitoxin system toxin component, PIN family [Roseofilum]|jgi:putative PIN family toxin of toxin-antitoxin system|uniref:Toxin-antitoxin system toxin component, PIN family n=2 Tax=Roseofilum TaxID=1233426 RepID=A0ABT7B644_9CYAN|nr:MULTISPECIES: putative toxin-antitoxin system toxin component, PIN family [Roseofilum]MDJ1171090.1 putative toxin-antitoxin system toxin component, PIN family [Roseofilum acuticapitatum BLCC-M154]MDJ1174644.1 putative toxin-antitoxin system toxin component, PIN family [Roseofilum capinflatum BLCC-M114]
MLKVVIDTSVFVAAMLRPTRQSSPRHILTLWREGRFSLVMAPLLLEELATRLIRQQVNLADIEDLLTEIIEIALHIPGVYEATYLDDIDPDDNKFLAAAYEAKADYLVSVDNHLLSLKYYHGTQVLTPMLFLRVLLDQE